MSIWSKWSDKLFDSQQRGWVGHKVNDILGDEFQHHLTDFTVTGDPFQAHYMGYQDAIQHGDSGWARVNRNSEKVAAILAAIYGGVAAAGGSTGGAGADAGAGGGAEAGGSIGSLYGAGGGLDYGASGSVAGGADGSIGSLYGANSGLDYSAAGGEGIGGGSTAGGANWQNLLGKALNAYGKGSQQGQSQGGYTDSGIPDFSQPAFVYPPEYKMQQYSIAPNQYNSGLMRGDYNA